ncbi:MAG TPA: hypothetical protein PKD79_02100 [Candidatus Doudnabacteria bacterium]|nr:hypothetical protein [Candidatus Doudnabacteria bacterium]
MQSQATAEEFDVEKIYQDLRDLLLEKDVRGARKYLSGLKFREVWDKVLHHAMKKRNCPVTKLIIVHAANRGIVSREEIQKRVSIIDHEIQKSFSSRIRDYLDSGDFTKALEEYSAVRFTAGSQLKTSTNLSILNPNAF